MDLNLLLAEGGIDVRSSRTLVMRHSPIEPELRKALPWLAAEQPAIYDAFQRSQSPKVERQLTKAQYLVSFIARGGSEALFIGVYRVGGSRPISPAEHEEIPQNVELRKLGMRLPPNFLERRSILWFDLQLAGALEQWKGKLIVDWPPPPIAWTRWANDNTFPVKAILEESALDKGMPDWDDLVLTWEELAHLPRGWIAKLSQWRGIYFIHDGKDGKGYVGSAYGEDNIYGRWRNYASSRDGGNVRLRQREPAQFTFSILELVSPTMSPDDVMRLEATWKTRLHTREHGLNAN